MKITLLTVLSFIWIQISYSQIQVKKKNVSCTGRNDGSIEIITTGLSGKITYAWSHDPNWSYRKAVNLKPGPYSVTISLGNCSVVKAALVTEPPKLNISLSPCSMEDLGSLCGSRQITRIGLCALPSGGTPPYLTSFGADNKQDFVTPFYATCVVTDSLGCVESSFFDSAQGIVICAKDPNDITGNFGLDSVRWIARKDELVYKVRFENDPIFATANASTVLIEVPLDDDIDPFSCRINNFGFGKNIFEVPQNSNTFQSRIDLTEEQGIFVDVTSGLDIANNKLVWLFETIDPVTGQPPIDPLAGFLPINDTLTGSGEGFISFLAKAKSNTLTGEIVDEQASIIFDRNEPILTNIWSNKVDAFPPTSIFNSLQDTSLTDSIYLCWTASDDIGGVGVKSYEVLYSINGGLPQLLADEWMENCLDFIGTHGNTYQFKVLASDKVGNKEKKSLFDQSIYIKQVKNINLLHASYVCSNDTLIIGSDITSIDSVEVSISFNNGNNFNSSIFLDTFDLPFKLYINPDHVGDTIRIKYKDKNSNYFKISLPVNVRPQPTVRCGSDESICAGEIPSLQASGANSYLWQPIDNIGTPFSPYTNVYTDTTLVVTLSGIDVYGCRNSDSLLITVLPTSRDTIPLPLCQGDSVIINGNYVSSAGFYTSTFSNANGCDSIIVSHVTYQSPCIWPGGQYVFVNDDATGTNTGMTWTNALNNLQDAIYIAGRYENIKEIWVAEGVYTPHPSNRAIPFQLKDSIQIIGGFYGWETNLNQPLGDPAITILSGDIGVQDSTYDNSFHIIKALASCTDCALKTLTLSYGNANNLGSDEFGAGILNYGKLKIQNVILERHQSTLQGAALFSTGESAIMTIANCIFRFNTSSAGKDVLNSNGSTMHFLNWNVIMD